MEEKNTIVLTLENDVDVTCEVIAVFEADNEKEYIALLPLDENGENETNEVYLYRYLENEDGSFDMANIEDDDEYDIAADAFDEILDELAFEDLGGDDFDEE